MNQNDIIEQHLLQLQTDWDAEVNTDMLDLLGAEEINSFPRSGILLQPGQKCFIILDPNDCFTYPYIARTAVKSRKKFPQLFQTFETKFLKISYIIPPSHAKIGSFSCSCTPMPAPPIFKNAEMKEIDYKNKTNLYFSMMIERPDLTDRDIISPRTITLFLPCP